MEPELKLCKNVTGIVVSFLSEDDEKSIMKIGNTSIDILNLIKSVIVYERRKLTGSTNILNIQLKSIPTLTLEKMVEDDKYRWCQAVIFKRQDDDWTMDTLCKVHLLLRCGQERYLKPNNDRSLLIKATEPKWLPCYCVPGSGCWGCFLSFGKWI